MQIAEQSLINLRTENATSNLHILLRDSIVCLQNFPNTSFFIYGSSALSLRLGDPLISAKKIRFRNQLPCRDIDICVYPELEWGKVVDASKHILTNSKGEFVLDPHLILADPNAPDNVMIKGVSLPRAWITTSMVEFANIQLPVIDIIPAIMLRILHAEARVRDTHRILKELSLLTNLSDLNDERIIC